MRGDEPPELAPVLAVGGEADVRRPVKQGVRDPGRRPRGEGVVVRAHDKLRSARRRHDQVRDGAEAEEHETAAVMLRGEAAEGDMRAVADEVQVADDGQGRRGRRQHGTLQLLLAAMTASARGGGEQQQEGD